MNLSLRTKLIGLVALPIIALVIVVYSSISLTNTLVLRFDEVADVSLPIVTAIEEIKFASSRLISSSNELILDSLVVTNADAEEADTDDDELAQIGEAILNYNHNLEIYRELVLANTNDIDDDSAHFDDIETVGQDLLDVVAVIIDLHEAGASVEDFSEQRTKIEESENLLLTAFDTALSEERDELLEASDAVKATANESTAFMSSVFATVLILVVAMVFYIARSIFRPLQALMTTATSLRQGDLSVRSKIDSQDELGEFASVFNEMADAVESRDKQQILNLAETEKARARAEQSDQAKSSFLASMSHELRTPLNAIINFSKFVAQGDLGPVNEDQEETLYEVVNSAKHLLNLINDVLDMSKIESGSLNLFVVDNVDLSSIITQVSSTATSLLDKKPVEISTQIAEDLPQIRGDRQRIVQILLNIMSNACKFTDTGSIIVNAYQQDDDVMISIKDTGLGIAPEDRDAVFEVFKQTESGLRKGGGTGLGMPITQNLIKAHGGTLQLESEPGKGTTFTISLPIKSDQLVPLLT